jgi:hypothetical protein
MQGIISTLNGYYLECVCFLDSFYVCDLKKISFKKLWLGAVSWI